MAEEKKGKGLFGKILDAVAPEVPEERPPAAPPKPSSGVAIPQAAPRMVTPIPSAVIDPQFAEAIEGALRGIPNQAYAKFRTLCDAMGAVQVETTRYQAAFGVASTQGITAAQVLDAIEQGLSALEATRQAFQEHLARKSEQSIGSQETEIRKLDEEVQSIDEQIKELQQERAIRVQRSTTLKSGIQQERDKLDTKQRKFVAACDAKVNQLNAEREKISRYSKGGS